MVDKIETVEGNERYLDKIEEVMECVVDPHVIYVNGEKIMVDSTDIFHEELSKKIFTIVKEEDKELKSYVVSLHDDGSIRTLMTDKYMYSICLDEEIPIVGRDTIETDDVVQLFCHKAGENNPRTNMHFYQMDARLSRELEFSYDVTLHDKCLDSLVNNINVHRPTSIDFIEYRRLIGYLCYKSASTYVRLEDGLNYSKSLINLKNFYTCLRLREYSINELKEFFESRGMLTSVPEEMISMYTKSNRLVKSLELVSNEYKRQVLGQ